MNFPIHFPDQKHADAFKVLLKKAKQITGASYYRNLTAALNNYLLKLRKERS